MRCVTHRQCCPCPALQRNCCFSPGLFIHSLPVKLLLTAGKDPIRCSRVPFKPFLSSTLDNSHAAFFCKTKPITYSERITRTGGLSFPPCFQVYIHNPPKPLLGFYFLLWPWLLHPYLPPCRLWWELACRRRSRWQCDHKTLLRGISCSLCTCVAQHHRHQQNPQLKTWVKRAGSVPLGAQEFWCDLTRTLGQISPPDFETAQIGESSAS